MKLIAKFIFHIFSNAVAIYAAAYFIGGFSFIGGVIELIVTSAILTLINLLLKPVLKLILGPFIVFTFGLFVIVINAITLYILDIVSQPLTIQGYLPLLYASLLIGVINLIINVSGGLAYKE